MPIHEMTPKFQFISSLAVAVLCLVAAGSTFHLAYHGMVINHQQYLTEAGRIAAFVVSGLCVFASVWVGFFALYPSLLLMLSAEITHEEMSFVKPGASACYKGHKGIVKQIFENGRAMFQPFGRKDIFIVESNELTPLTPAQ